MEIVRLIRFCKILCKIGILGLINSDYSKFWWILFQTQLSFLKQVTLLRLNAQAELDFKNKAPENKPAVEDSKTSYKMDQPGMWT